MTDKKKLFAYIAAGILAIAIVALGAYLKLTEEQPEWPYAAVGHSEEVSLSQAVNLLAEPGDDRRAAVIGGKVYIERLKGAGDDAEALEEAFEAKAERETEAEKEEGEKPARTEPELAVVVAEISSKNSEFAEKQAEVSTFDIQIYDDSGDATWFLVMDMVFRVLFFGLIGVVLFTMVRGGLPGSQGHEIVKADDLKTGLDDVAGIDVARADVEEIIAFMREPEKASGLGGRMPRGLLLDGPPGTGKTLLARAMAKEAGVAFMKVDSTTMTQMFVGMGAKRVRSVFREARKNAPCIIFMDEFDSVGRARGGGRGDSVDSEKENTLNTLLTELDGFESRDGIFLIAATNRAELLDPALTRPGRIDRRITMRLPDIGGREAILKVHSAKVPLDDEIDLRAIAATTYGFSGAELENLVNEAALAAGRAGRDKVTAEDFAFGRDRLLLPRGSSETRLDEDERRLTAVHEAGHALIAALNPEADPIEKVTIAPQGPAAGFVMQAPNRDRSFETLARLKARIQVAVAGREAERLVFGAEQVTTGAASDIQQATRVARAMVTTYGMSELGFVEINPNDPVLFDMSNSPLPVIKQIIENGQTTVVEMLSEHRAALDELTELLLERETIPGREVHEMVARSTRPAAQVAVEATAA